MELIFEDSGFIIKTISALEEFEAALKLRHEVFARELKWVRCSQDGMETDEYDRFAECIGVFRMDMSILGHARLITHPYPFMVEKEFACMMPAEGEFRKRPDMAEITRLCVKKEEREKNASLISRLIYKAIYNWSALRGVRRMVMVVDKRYYRLLRLCGFPVTQLADFVTMPDGVVAGAIELDWGLFEELCADRRPELLAWISTLPARYPSLSQSHEPYLRH
ncbi:GNAT family N-acetyltransferase [bacterium]|nr:GNAT family N-acetyltransferase [bacterium]